MRKHRRIWVALAFGAVFAWASALAWLTRPTRPNPENVDAIVVLGCRVLPSGEPSVALAKRAREGARQYLDGVAPVIVFTGGVGTHGRSEASAAAGVAKRLGVPAEAIILEEFSTSTTENAEFVARTHPFQRVMIVTDRYHAYRAKRVFEQSFVHVETATVPTQFPYVLWSGSRELLAIAFYTVTGRI